MESPCQSAAPADIGSEHCRSRYQAIEQNAEKPSRWGQLARDGHQVVQFKDAEANKFVAVAVDGEVTIYGGRERRKGSAG